MIEFAQDSHRAEIIALWQEAFGDSEAEIAQILENIYKYAVVFEEKGAVLGMLFLLPVSCSGRAGRYVYAVATFKKYRGRGVSTALLDFAKKLAGTDGFLVLVPQSRPLFDFYEKRGFTALNCCASGHISAAENGELRLMTISAEEYFKRRHSAFAGRAVIEWPPEMLEAARAMYGGRFAAVLSGRREIGTAFLAPFGKTLYIKELLTSGNAAEIAAAAAWSENAEEAVYSCPGSGVFAMTYPEMHGAYFNIAMD